jgi:hypothetical protein
MIDKLNLPIIMHKQPCMLKYERKMRKMHVSAC